MDRQTRSWHFADEHVLVDKIVVGPLDNNVFLVVCAETAASVVIDASAAADDIVAMAAGTKVAAVLTTHGHWDHVGAAAELAATLGVDVMIGPEDAAASGLIGTTPLDEGPMELGALELEVIATPGHTPGSRCIKVGPLIFTGDTLFPGGPGATQSPAQFGEIMHSLDTKLFTHPDATMILPGHGLDTTIGTERPAVEEWRRRGW